MAFDVRQFKSRIDDFHRPSYFDVLIDPPTGGGRLFQIKTEAISSPSISYLSVDGYRPYGSGLTYDIPYSQNPQEITCTHTLDQNGELLQILWDWANLTVDLVGDGKYGAYYYDDYAIRQMQIYCYDGSDRRIKTFQLNDVHLKSMESISLSWDSVDEVTKVNATYGFTNFRIS